MSETRPPRLEGDERETLQALLQYTRDSVVRKVTGLSDEDARRRLVDSDTTLLWLVKHLNQAEILWLEYRFAGLDVTVPDATVQPDDTLSDAVDAYVATWARVDAIAAAADLEQSCANVGDETPVNLRWVLVHLLEETARHAGHADILREQIDGSTGR
ncbi:MAG: DinB family protein [Acidimicrobiia bacterium]